jgi:hypothetical protein
MEALDIERAKLLSLDTPSVSPILKQLEKIDENNTRVITDARSSVEAKSNLQTLQQALMPAVPSTLPPSQEPRRPAAVPLILSKCSRDPTNCLANTRWERSSS